MRCSNEAFTTEIYYPADENEIALAENIFEKSLVKSYIKYLPQGKAPGESKITSELLKLEEENTSSLLTCFFKTAFIFQCVPDCWRSTIIVPVPKKGDKSLVENYRPISLLEHSRKIFEIALLNHLKPTMSPLAMEQGGFRENRSTMDQCLCLDEIIRTIRNKNRKYPVVCFLDIKSAYDSVDRKILFQKLHVFGIDRVTISSIKQLFDTNVAKIRINEKCSSSFSMPAGVQQGSILSPLLYSIFINDLVYELKKGPVIKCEGLDIINCLLYADDIALVANNEKDMNCLLKIVHGFAQKNNFLVNIAKCAYIYQKDLRILFDGQRINKVTNFNYLGINFAYHGICVSEHVKNNIEKSKNAFKLLKRIGVKGNGYENSTKILAYKSMIRSRIEYGLAAIRTKVKDIELLEKAQHKFLCEIFGVGVNTSRKSLQLISKMCSMKIRVNILQAKFLVRYEKIRTDDSLLLPKITKWLENATKLISRITALKNDEEVTRIVTAINTSEGPNGVKDVYNDYFQNIFSEISIIKNSEISSSSSQKIFNLLNDGMIDRKSQRIAILFLLNKIPGKPSKCLRCNENVTKEHIFTCNTKIWSNFIKWMSKFRKIELFRPITRMCEYEFARIPYTCIERLSQFRKSKSRKTIFENFFCLFQKAWTECCFEKTYPP